ncbi:UDP-galactopyranose mutase [Aquimarina amphilecti]|uniref:UDP-galactopyranose mutase n=1 Tax=Aquimarina amphilecti TaxID=1038014 RepID=A0A1H7L0F2_AQUAM|nr:NAD(P)/FAD-dependent oxidoreductase [Aquimarina amphilecti]SEK91727.1 UDP-galactopyranose mutase [Aquimarina amphilecti]
MAKKVIVIGAGPAGLSAAYTLSKNDIDVEVFEASSNIGGMSRSFDLWGQRVDLGPHRFFSKEPKINNFFDEIVKDDYTLVNRLTRIYYKKRFFDYPLKLLNVLGNLSIATIFSILFYYGKQRLFPVRNPETFEKWVTNRFGKKLYTIFFKYYTEKLWGIPCSKIDADWAAQRIKGLSLFEAVWNAFKGNKGNKHKTLVDEFSYPKNGTGTLYERSAIYVEENDGVIHKNKPVQSIVIENNQCKGIITIDGEKHEADYVISSMPLTSLLKGMDSVPKAVLGASNKLYFRNTILVYLEIDRDDLFEDNWIYVHSPEVKHGRITNFRNWCPSLNKGKKSTILCLEFWAFDSDSIWSADDKYLSDLAIRELKVLKLINESEVVNNAKIVRVPKCYPVYEIGYRNHLDVIENYLDNIEKLIPIGRYGAFKYNNQDHSILMGILAAENIINNTNVDLWKINTDTEYQEDGDVKDVLIQ